MRVNENEHSINSAGSYSSTSRSNWWNRIQNAIFNHHANENDNNEHEPLLTSTDSSQVRRCHQIAILEGEGEGDCFKSSESLPDTTSPGSVSASLSSLAISHDSALKNYMKSKGK